MKRERDNSNNDIETMAMANCLMLLSKLNESEQSKPADQGREFVCKSCDRRFSSFQALGGHRASHKKPKLSEGQDASARGSPKKPKAHECPICGLEFAIGQALGGHMRRHRAATAAAAQEASMVSRPLLPVPVLKKSNSSKRVLCLDLNLSPLENDLRLELGKMSSHLILGK